MVLQWFCYTPRVMVLHYTPRPDSTNYRLQGSPVRSQDRGKLLDKGAEKEDRDEAFGV